MPCTSEKEGKGKESLACASVSAWAGFPRAPAQGRQGEKFARHLGSNDVIITAERSTERQGKYQGKDFPTGVAGFSFHRILRNLCLLS